MKTKRNLFLFAGLIIGCLINGCGRSDLPAQNVVYIKAAEVSVSTTLAVDDANGGEMAVLASSSQIAPTDVLVDISVDTSLIEKYNQVTGKHYSPLPEGSYILSGSSVTIPKGTSLSDAINFKVVSTKNFKEGVSYVMPVTIKNSNGLPTLEASRTLYVLISRTIITSVASLTGNYFKVDFRDTASLKALKTLTFETRVMVNNFQQSSPYISSLMGIEENFLLRFGDVTIPLNQLQLAGGNTATNASTFSTGLWYHVAAVYDGSKVQLYVNGQIVGSKDAARTIDLTDDYSGGFHFGYSANGRLLDGNISEARIWSRALTSAEINNGMCGVDPSSPDLVGYWKFNEGQGNVAKDISGHGFDAVAARDVTWVPDVRCN